MNGDGIDDLVLDAVFADPEGKNSAGESYVFFGRNTALVGNFPAVFPLALLMPAKGGDGSEGFVLPGVSAEDDSGRRVSGAGDLNGDGYDDIVIGAPWADPRGQRSAGETYVVFGRDTVQSGNFPAIFPLRRLTPAGGADGSEGFMLTGIDADDALGRRVGSAGDVNGDGHPDLLVGAPFADPHGHESAGESYVVFGRDAAQVGAFPAVFPVKRLTPSGGGDGSEGFVLNGIDTDDKSGRSTGAAGDINGDGIDDLIVGALMADPGGRSQAGESYVVFGRDTARVGNFPALFDLSRLATGDGRLGFVLNGIDADDRSGNNMASAGDIHGDGIDDLLIGGYHASPGGKDSAGETYVVFGRDTAGVGNFPAVFELSSLATGDGSVGFVLNGIDAGDTSGISMSGVHDVNGDGIDDFVIGALYAGANTAGESYVVYGRDTDLVGSFPAVFQLSTLAAGDGSEGFVLRGTNPDDRAGRTVATAGDLNADGIADIVIGAFHADPGDRPNAGANYVLFGRGPATESAR
jgi:hypothetical protein